MIFADIHTLCFHLELLGVLEIGRVFTEITSEDGGNVVYDASPATNALILYEYGLHNDFEFEKPVSILVSSLKPYMNPSLREVLNKLSVEKKLKLINT